MRTAAASILAGVLLLVVTAGTGAVKGGGDGGIGMTDGSWKKLTPEEERVIVRKGTERPFTGKYWNFKGEGTYTCKRCGAELFRSRDKFDSECGWPSFDDAIPGAVKSIPDADGVRTEIVCAACGGHLGHVFEGEGLTDKNTRYCVNSISTEFVAAQKFEEGFFAGGCFWGVEHLMQKLPGVISVESGYMGGTVNNPTYEQVCTGRTGHLETVRVVFDPAKVSFEDVAKLFFEIHDPTQADGQGPDLGQQYHSAVFYVDAKQKEIAEKLVGILKSKGLKVVTSIRPAAVFWKAEDYHQDYYARNGKTPYCHARVRRF
jgi:peptide methionine sulfoxide reductase msrA/msrB